MPELKLDSQIQYLKGVGPRRAASLAGVGIITVYDLLQYLPRRYLDRSMIVPIGALQANMEVTIVGRVLGKGILRGRRSRLEVVLGDDTGIIALIWFAGYRYLEKMFTKDDIYAATGTVSYYQQRQIVHPEMERIEDEESRLIHTGRIVPVYPSTAELKKAGVTSRLMRGIISRALEMMSGRLVDYLPERYLAEPNLCPLPDAIQQIHYPDDMDSKDRARTRLAFDELLSLQYMILQNRKERKRVSKAHTYHPPGDIVKRFTETLPFTLTEDQQTAAGKILSDMQSDRPMHRLLQGDVGCGKTVVALAASVYAAENNLQTAFMAPTEILAEQHFQSWREVLEKLDIPAALLTGSIGKAEREQIERRIADGTVDIVFGTHAVISESVQFAALGLVVIDEQHRFGVLQRGKLITKGTRPDTLVMTATPIPRTLALTLYGDLDISSVKTMPPGRQTTRTVWRTANSRPEIYSYLKERIQEKEQVFIIYPLVEKSEKLDLQAAEDEYKRLKKEVFADCRVGLVHGRTKKDKREKTLADFRAGKIDVLVATTVIEVGIDIPSATIMVIEHAERFGLSQLHQLRGRVGRGEKRGTTIAIAVPPLSDLAKKRLNMFQASTDGFKIAEADLELRGPGEFFGTRQHGLPELRVANLVVDSWLLPITRKIVTELLRDDKELDREDSNLLSCLRQMSGNRRDLSRFG
ncbi:MAG: ATP-dependent DNA helicase RecG [candidate division Zixibacteria bacterium]|nr:ATP-dependent DNA helicase RecG [candidate division Zixibacteria bacterium]